MTWQEQRGDMKNKLRVELCRNGYHRYDVIAYRYKSNRPSMGECIYCNKVVELPDDKSLRSWSAYK